MNTNLHKCDIVMKGGITSGVVYPSAVYTLSKRYQFQSIGGTSAGAIAACLAAAAEYSRWKGKDVFEDVGKIPDWLGKPSDTARGSNLFNLFQPQAGVRGLYRIAVGYLQNGWFRRSAVWLRVLWLEVLIGLIPGLILIYFANVRGWLQFVVLAVPAVFALLTGIAVLIALGLLLRFSKIPSHHFGFCIGYTKPQPDQPPSLVGWLHGKINELAGIPEKGVLTFGQLKDAEITLRLITTCLTFGRPYTLPFESAEFYFLPEELRAFFPKEVMEWLEAHPGLPKSDHQSDIVDLGPYLRLPDHQDLPVIVAARLSLSFPLLFCAVPLYAIDWTRRRRNVGETAPTKEQPGGSIGPDEPRRPERVWFSDGGICSNFPIHLFDSLLPRWPTFGINLMELRPDRPDKDDRTWVPGSNRGGIAHHWTRLKTNASLRNDGGYISAMFNAARNWTDNLQSSVPGYRDRIATVYLDGKKEGGLTLNMSKEVVKALSDFGQAAAEKLIDHFLEGMDGGHPTPMTWDNHRWVRYRSSIELLQETLQHFQFSIKSPEPGDRTYFELIDRDTRSPPNSYPLSREQAKLAGELTDRLADMGSMSEPGLDEGAPKPEPAIRIRPKY